MIKIANGAYTYGTQTGFHDVNINVNRGDAVCIMGPNGSGKSTLLKTIVGLFSLVPLDTKAGTKAVAPGRHCTSIPALTASLTR